MRLELAAGAVMGARARPDGAGAGAGTVATALGSTGSCSRRRPVVLQQQTRSVLVNQALGYKAHSDSAFQAWMCWAEDSRQSGGRSAYASVGSTAGTATAAWQAQGTPWRCPSLLVPTAETATQEEGPSPRACRDPRRSVPVPGVPLRRTAGPPRAQASSGPAYLGGPNHAIRMLKWFGRSPVMRGCVRHRLPGNMEAIRHLKPSLCLVL